MSVLCHDPQETSFRIPSNYTREKACTVYYIGGNKYSIAQSGRYKARLSTPFAWYREHARVGVEIPRFPRCQILQSLPIFVLLDTRLTLTLTLSLLHTGRTLHRYHAWLGVRLPEY